VRPNSGEPLPRVTVALIVVYALVLVFEAFVSRLNFSNEVRLLGQMCPYVAPWPDRACVEGLPFNLALNEPLSGAMVALGGNFYPLTIEGGQWWRLLTLTLLHGGITHFGFNSLATWNIGKPLESRAGWKALVTTFVVSGGFASLASTLINPRETIGIGASGAVFGMFGFVIVWGVSDIQQFIGQIRRNLVIMVVMVGSSAIIPGIDNVAHIGGLLAGLLLGFVWERLPEPVKTGLGFSSAVALLAAFGMIVISAFPLMIR
jgi:membrane associated rhomboid family serine protease